MAIVQYDRAYKQKGFMRLAHFLRPRVLDAEKFDFPRNSVLHWLKISDKMVDVTKDYVYFKNLPDAYVNTIAEYTENATSGKFMVKQFNLDQIISANGKICKDFDFLRSSANKKKKELILSIYNYSATNIKYIYNQQPMLRYHRFKNAYITLFTNMFRVEPDRHKFVIIDLPNKLLKRNEYDKFAKSLSNANIDKFPTDEALMMLEFWKYIDINLHKDSVLSIIPMDKAKNVNILFKYNNKYLWLTLYVIVRSIREFRQKFSIENYSISNEELVLPKVTPKGSEDFKKIFYTMLEQFIALPAMSDAELEKQEKDIDQKRLDDLEEEPGSVRRSNPIVEEKVDTTTIQRPQNLNDMITVLKNQNNISTVVNTHQQAEEGDIDDSVFQAELKKLTLNEDEEVKDVAPEEEVDDITNDDSKEQITMLDKLLTRTLDEGEELIDSLDDILKEKNDMTKVEKRIDELKKTKQITTQQMKTLKATLDKQKKLKDPFKSKQDLTEVLDDSKDKLTVTEEEVAITPTKTVFDSSYNKNITDTLRKNYILNQYNKDLVRCIYNLQNSKFIIDKYEVIEKEDGLGDIQEHHITIRTLDNKIHPLMVKLPKLKEDGTFVANGMSYLMRWQRQDFPIKKIAPTVVKLTSYYRKINLEKARYKKADVGQYILNSLNKLSVNNKDFNNIVAVPSKNQGVKLPQDYEHFSRLIKYISYQDYRFFFEYNKRNSLIKDSKIEDIKKLEGDKSVLVGTLKNVPIVMDEFSRLYLYQNNKYTELPDLYELLGINRLQEPVEFAYVTILGKLVPVVYVLCYYYGLGQLLKVLKTEVTYYKPNQRVTIEKPCFVVKFKDVKLVITRDYGLSDMILGGLLDKYKLMATINSTSLNSKDEMLGILTRLDYGALVVNEIKLIEFLFIDPMTLSVLREHKLPETFKGLLIKASELLLDDYSENNNKITTCTIKGYERIAGMFYNVLINAIREYEMANMYSKKKISIHPLEIIKRIQEDSTTSLVDNLNPIAELKQFDDVSYLGEFGYNKRATSMSIRNLTPSEVGVISEAAKDNGDVGLTSYLTANPNITNIRGETKELDKDASISSMVSTNALLMPFILSDDASRVSFSSIQASHIIPINQMRVPYVRTGYESIVAVRASDKFVVCAEAEGVVTKVTPSSVEVKYKDKSKSYKIKNWTSKEESESCYTHIMKANVKPGDKVRKDDTLIYDTAFFEPDIFDPKRVIYKQGDMVNVALIEEPSTYEDSAAISAKLNNRLGTTVTKTKSIVVEATSNIFNIVKVGQEVQPSDILLSAASGYMTAEKVDKKILDLLKNIQTMSPKAKVEGKISKILVRYNCDLKEMSKTLRDIAIDSDKALKAETGFIGQVLDNNYRIGGKPLVQGQVEIKFYITTTTGMGIGDKAIFGNQLKFTVGNVYENNIQAEDGTPVEAKFSLRSISARIVNSATLYGTTAMVLEKLEEQAIKLYFGS